MVEGPKNQKRIEGVGQRETPPKEEKEKIVKEEEPSKADAQIFQKQLEEESKLFGSMIDNMSQLFEIGHDMRKRELAADIEEIEIGDTSAEQLRQKRDEIVEKAKKSKKYSENYINQLSDLVKNLQNLEIQNTSDIQRFNTYISEITSIVNEIRNAFAQVDLWGQQAQILHQRYTEALVRENNFESREDLSEKYFRLYDQKIELHKKVAKLAKQYPYPLVGGIVSRFFNRNKIRQNLAEIAGIEERQKSLQLLIDRSGKQISVPWIGYEQQESVKERIADAARIVIEKTQAHYETLLRQFQTIETELQIKLNETQIESLNDDLINKYVLPEIEAKKQELAELQGADPNDKALVRDLGKRIQRLSDKKLVAKAIQLLRNSFGVRMSILYRWDLSEEERQKEEQERLKQAEIEKELNSIYDRSYELGSIVRYFMIIDIEPANNSWQEMIDFLHNPSLPGNRNQLKATYSDILGKIKVALSEYYIYYGMRDLNQAVKQRLEQFQLEDSSQKLNEFVANLDVKRWEVFKENEQIQQIFGADQIEQANLFLFNLFTAQLLMTKKHTEESVKLGTKLIDFKNPEAIPLMILNAFREPGYSGGYPFLESLPKICREVSEQRSAELKQLAIPGLSEVIDLIKNNPKDFAKSTIQDAETGKYIDNPVRKKN